MAPTDLRYEIGPVTFTPDTGELERAGQVTRLRPQASQVLELLVRRPADLVTRDELKSALWPRGHVDADLGLNVCVQQIRAALSDDPDTPEFIETLRGRGYRLIAPVVPGAANSQPKQNWLTRGVLALTALAVTVGAVAFATSGHTPIRVAILPFTLDSAPASRNDFMIDALTDEIITMLARADPDRVAIIARTSVAELIGRGMTVPDLAERLEADYVLQGLIKRVGNERRLTASLTNTQSNTYVWSIALAIENPLQRSVQQAIANGVLQVLSPEATIASVPDGDMSQSSRYALLRARYLRSLFTRRDSRLAVDLLQEALTVDSTEAALWVELGANLLVLGRVDSAEWAVQHATMLNAEAEHLRHVSGRIALYGRNDPWSAIGEFAIAANHHPGTAAIHHDYAQALATVGRLSEAVEHGERAIDLDPVSSVVLGDIGWIFYYAGEFDSARKTCNETIDLRPTSTSARKCVLLASAAQGKLAEERDRIDEMLAMLGADPTQRANVLDDLKEGRTDPLWSAIRDLSRAAGLNPMDDARLYALQGRQDEAIRALEAGSAQSNVMAMALWDPVLAAARRLPTFDGFIKSAGLTRHAGRTP